MLKRDLTGKQDLKSQIYDWKRFGQIKLSYSTWTTNYRSKSVYFLILRREFLHLHIISLAQVSLLLLILITLAAGIVETNISSFLHHVEVHEKSLNRHIIAWKPWDSKSE